MKLGLWEVSALDISVLTKRLETIECKASLGYITSEIQTSMSYKTRSLL